MRGLRVSFAVQDGRYTGADLGLVGVSPIACLPTSLPPRRGRSLAMLADASRRPARARSRRTTRPHPARAAHPSPNTRQAQRERTARNSRCVRLFYYSNKATSYGPNQTCDVRLRTEIITFTARRNERTTALLLAGPAFSLRYKT